MGVSTSLQYAPAPYATTEELIALASRSLEVRRRLRNAHASEGNAILEAIDEAMRIGREATIPVEIWHLKAAGKRNWGCMPRSWRRSMRRGRSGVESRADTYAYPAWFNSFVGVHPAVGA